MKCVLLCPSGGALATPAFSNARKWFLSSKGVHWTLHGFDEYTCFTNINQSEYLSRSLHFIWLSNDHGKWCLFHWGVWLNKEVLRGPVKIEKLHLATKVPVYSSLLGPHCAFIHTSRPHLSVWLEYVKSWTGWRDEKRGELWFKSVKALKYPIPLKISVCSLSTCVDVLYGRFLVL